MPRRIEECAKCEETRTIFARNLCMRCYQQEGKANRLNLWPIMRDEIPFRGPWPARVRLSLRPEDILGSRSIDTSGAVGVLGFGNWDDIRRAKRA